MGLAEGAQPLLDQGRVGQHPAVQGGVVHLQTALQEQLLDVTVAERVAQVPRDGLQDQRCLEVPALEIVLRPALQLLGNRAQDHRPPPVRRRICGPQAQRGVNTKNFATRPPAAPPPPLRPGSPLPGAGSSPPPPAARTPAPLRPPQPPPAPPRPPTRPAPVPPAS